MKLTNSTDYPDYFLRRLVSWCCKEIGLPVRYVAEAKFGRSSGRCRGMAWGHRFRVSVRYPTYAIYDLPKYKPGPIADRCKGMVGVRRGSFSLIVKPERAEATLAEMKKEGAEASLVSLIKITAHELVHLWLYREGSNTRRSGRPGGSEAQTEWHEHKVYEAFQAKRKELLAAWSKPPKKRQTKPKPSLQEKRAMAAQEKLSEWQRKQKLATTKVKLYKARVRYYDRAMAATKERSDA